MHRRTHGIIARHCAKSYVHHACPIPLKRRISKQNAMSINTPAWVRNAVFYQIFPDRFAATQHAGRPSNLESWDSKPTVRGFKGGDLYGVIEKLNYLADLGINAIYFTPLFQSTANHRYHTHDFFRIDPILGGDVAFDKLLKAAHKKKIRVVIDGAFNHASRGFYQFSHALENGRESPYLDWFHIQGFPLNAYDGKPNYSAWWDIPDLPKLNTDAPAVREFIWRCAEYWLERGIDGWRLDVPAEIDDDDFWRTFRARVKAVNPDAYIVGEIWHDAQRWLQGDQFDAVMNYQITRASVGFFSQGKWDAALVEGIGYAPIPKLDASGFAFSLNATFGLYDKAINDVQLNLLGSHDTARILSIFKDDRAAVNLAMLCMMTLPGAPCVYYGDEIGLPGAKDPDCRRAFPWDETAWQHDTRTAFKTAIALRHKYRALRDGSFRVVYAVGQVVAYLREADGKRLLVVLNAGSQAAIAAIHVQDALPHGATLKSVLGPALKTRNQAGVLDAITVPGKSGVVLLANA
jgi:cyclomaltodextrinase / maltogenic alpha-amylase / neopullulanase